MWRVRYHWVLPVGVEDSVGEDGLVRRLQSLTQLISISIRRKSRRFDVKTTRSLFVIGSPSPRTRWGRIFDHVPYQLRHYQEQSSQLDVNMTLNNLPRKSKMRPKRRQGNSRGWYSDVFFYFPVLLGTLHIDRWPWFAASRDRGRELIPRDSHSLDLPRNAFFLHLPCAVKSVIYPVTYSLIFRCKILDLSTLSLLSVYVCWKHLYLV